MTIDFTVAIPTYNGACRLPKVLEKLQMQVGVEHLNWEIIIVDNNSSDGTAKLVEEYQASWRHRAKLRYCVECKQGALESTSAGDNGGGRGNSWVFR